MGKQIEDVPGGDQCAEARVGSHQLPSLSVALGNADILILPGLQLPDQQTRGPGTSLFFGLSLSPFQILCLLVPVLNSISSLSSWPGMQAQSV